MDVDAFTAERTGRWRRLDELAGRRRLTGAEVDELVTGYQRAAADLALVRSRLDDPELVGALSGTVARARAAAIGGSRRTGWAALGHGVRVDFPLAVYVAWRWWVGTMAASLGLAGALMLYLRDHPERIDRVLSQADVRALVNRDFADYYSAHPARSFALQVWTNNALVAAFALLLGVTLIGTVYVLWGNVVNLGLTGGAMLGAGKAGIFFGLLAPHGILELTAVFVASGAGLRMGWAWVAPGVLPRAQSLAAAGRSAVVIALGLVGVLLVSGVMEAFVTPSGLPTPVRIGIGVVAEVLFLLYVVIGGRRAIAAGETGDLRADERESVAPVG